MQLETKLTIISICFLLTVKITTFMKSLNVFIIDDDKLFVFLTKKIINTTNLETHIKEFRDGKYAIDYLRQTLNSSELLPDIILLDLNMPIMDGWGFLEEYKTMNHN